MLRFHTYPDYKLFTGSLAGLLYGLGARLAFKSGGLEDYLGLITFGFAVLVPLAIGALTVAFAPRQYKTSWIYAIFMPWLPCLLLAVLVAVLAWEVVICILMALPIFMGMASLGGAAVALIFTRFKGWSSSTGAQASLLGLVVLAPYLLTPLERQLTPPALVQTVHTRITIQAEPETVWHNLIAVPHIRPEEHHPALFRWLGLPTPLEAILSEPGQKGKRYAVYDNGLALLEPVTEWRPYRRYTFAVSLDPTFPAPPPFDQVGGRYFEVQQVGFDLEPNGAGGTVLHLHSRYRLSTWLNGYGRWWFELLLSDLQTYILGIIKTRSEAGFIPAADEQLKASGPATTPAQTGHSAASAGPRSGH